MATVKKVEKTRRQKIEAIAKTADYNPAEAAVAQSMLDSAPEGKLEAIATSIKAEYGKGIDSQFAIGRLLGEARATFPGDTEFGKWLAAQEFPFSRPTAIRLRQAAEREPEVRAAIAARSDQNGRDVSVAGVIQALNAAPKQGSDVGEAAPVDSAYAAIRNAYNRVLVVVDGEPTGNAFLTMHDGDLAKAKDFIQGLVNAYSEARAARRA